ncbi:MAG: hypothetical protein R3B70_34445 [Polyangiaceae bacterium]
MLARLLVGILKGLVLGALLGFGLVKLGMAVPGAVVAYIAAAVTGILIGLVAGKPIWAKDARIEAGMKAGVGALLGVGLMFAARRWLTMPVPDGLLTLTKATVAEGTTATLGGFSMTSLAAIAALLGGFYDADNTPEPDKPEAKKESSAPADKKRIATPTEDEEFEDELEAEPEKKKEKK